MAIWRSPALEALLGGPVDETGRTEDAVLRLVAAGAREGVELEFKRDPHPGAPAGRSLAEAVRDTARWWRQDYRFSSPLGRVLQAHGEPIAGPDRTTLTGRPPLDDDDEADPRFSYIELHADGSAFAATPVELNTGDDGGIGVVTLVDDMTVIADACLSWTLRQTGTWGTADVICGLRDGAAPDGELTRPAELVDYSHGQSRVRLNPSPPPPALRHHNRRPRRLHNPPGPARRNGSRRRRAPSVVRRPRAAPNRPRRHRPHSRMGRPLTHTAGRTVG